MLILISVCDRSIQLITATGDEAGAVQPTNGRFGKWSGVRPMHGPSDDSYSPETAAENRRATILKTMCSGRV